MAADNIERKYQFKFSVIVPVYNTEQYLEETLESVVGQTIGFQENIQLILVNNATQDNSGLICEKYKEKYPDNIDYVVLSENNGPCGARNAGIPYVKGKYVNFLDSDDKWSLDAFEKVYIYFEQHFSEIDIVACRIKHFDATDAWHGLDRKFDRDKTISIFNDYSCVQLSLCSTFLKAEVVSEFRFDERVRHAEDAKYITEILLNKPNYALLRSVVFYYRTRSTGTSVLQTVAHSYSWYFDTPRYVFEYLFDLSNEKYGYVIPYVQYLVMYELQWRLRTPLPVSFTEDESINYKNLIIRLIKKIDDFIICEQRNLFREYKLYALSLKYDRDVRRDLICREEKLCFHNIDIYPRRTRSSMEIAIVDIVNGELYIEGCFTMALPPDAYRIIAVKGNEIYPLELFYLDESDKRIALGEIIHEVRGFRVKIPLGPDGGTDRSTIVFRLQYRGMSLLLGYHFHFICKLTNERSDMFWRCGDYILKPEGVRIEVYPYTKRLAKQFERTLEKNLLKEKNYKLWGWRRLIIAANALLSRRKPIWLILDGFSFAGDNGECFFRYLMEHPNRNIRPYFVIDKASKDYARMKKTGPVIAADSKLYRLLFALSSKIISSQSFYNTQNTFYERTEFLQDLFHFDFVYLQHGVIKDNHADTQSRYKKDFALFITSAEKEKDSIVNGVGGNYCYDESVVKVTGLARHDPILSARGLPHKKKILLAPTWRKDGVGGWNERVQTYEYSSAFKGTNFYKFYQRLISDQRILDSLDKNGYTMIVRLHPRSIQQAEDFVPGKNVILEKEKPKYYLEELKDTALLITDYSSIAFDYAYAYIPIVYTQYDADTFYINHGYKRGYFDYGKDGFGPVCSDYESTVSTILSTIEHGCVMDEKYQRRVNAFFAYHDGKNCERIYQEILKLDQKA